MNTDDKFAFNLYYLNHFIITLFFVCSLNLFIYFGDLVLQPINNRAILC